MKEGWEYKKLGEVAQISSGKAIPSSLISDTISEGLYPCYGGNGLRGYVDRFSNEGLIPVIGRVGALCGNVHLPQGKFYATEHALVVNIKTNDKPQYLEYILKQLDLRAFAKGVAQPVLSASTLSTIPIPIPPFTEQERIVSELDLLTSIINKQKAQLKELDSLAQSIFYDMFGDPIENPKGWEVKNLGYEFDVSSGGTPSTKNYEYWNDGKISWIGSNMCQNKIINENDGKYITNEGLEHSSAKLYTKGFVLIALVGATIGKVALLGFETTTNQNIAGVDVPSNKDYKSIFIFYLIQSLYCFFENIGDGKFKMANLSFVRSLPIIKPPLSLI